ncbi:MerR family transcriptional regulator [Caproiciproducens sp.]
MCGGVRRFSEEDLEWLGLVFCLKNTGMPIKKIREFVDLSRRGEQTLPQRCEILMAHKRDVEGRIASMKKQLAKVNQKIQCFSSQSKAFCVSGKIQRPLV